MSRLDRPALREELLAVLRPVLTARGVVDVASGPRTPEQLAELLDEAALALERARSTRGLPPAGRVNG